MGDRAIRVADWGTKISSIATRTDALSNVLAVDPYLYSEATDEYAA